MSNEITWRLENENIGRLLVHYAIPAVIGTMVNALYNIVDRIFIGQGVGALAISGLTLTFPILLFMQAFGMLIGAGAATRVSIHLGRKANDLADNVLGNAFTLTFIIGALTIIPSMIFLDDLLMWFGGSEQTIPYAKDYLYIAIPGNLLATLSFSFNAVMRASGYPKKAMFTMMIGAVLNVILDPIFIFWLDMGIQGAAIATVAAQAVSAVFALVLLVKKNLPFQIKKEDFHFNSQCRRLLQVGFPLAMQEFLTQMSFLALCAFINRLGLEASSGYGVACKIVNFAMLIPSSLMQSMASFVSQNVGAGNEKRAKKAMFTGIGIGLIIGCVVFVLVLLKGDVLTGLFTTDAAVVQKGFEYLKGFAPETIATAVLFSMVGYFNGHDKTLWVMTQGLMQTLLVRLPMAYYMSIQPDASLMKIGLAAPTATVFGIVLNVGFFLWCRKREK